MPGKTVIEWTSQFFGIWQDEGEVWRTQPQEGVRKGVSTNKTLNWNLIPGWSLGSLSQLGLCVISSAPGSKLSLGHSIFELKLLSQFSQVQLALSCIFLCVCLLSPKSFFSHPFSLAFTASYCLSSTVVSVLTPPTLYVSGPRDPSTVGNYFGCAFHFGGSVLWLNHPASPSCLWGSGFECS